MYKKGIKKSIFLFSCICYLMGLTACEKETFSIDQHYTDALLGEYQVAGNDTDGDDFVGSWWHLSIRNTENDELELSIYDNEAGNPGIQGKVLCLNDKEIVIEYDPDYYEELPSSKWKLHGKRLSMTYQLTDDGIILTNNKKSINFSREWETITYAGHWMAPDSYELKDINITDTTLELKGWIHDPVGDWIEGEHVFELSEDCDYNECLIAGEYVEKEKFLKALHNKNAAHSVVEVDVEGDKAIEMRLIGSDESSLAE